MRKGEQTRMIIIQKSAELFNVRGYAGSSIKDIMQVTGLKKGGIYRHFTGKDQLAAEAFDYATAILSERFSAAIESTDTAIEKALVIFDVYKDAVNDPPVIGGCPLLNTAIESDDTHPVLREQALQVMKQFLSTIQEFIQDGIQTGELRSDTEVVSLSSLILSTLEGAIMASKLTHDNSHIAYCKEHLRRYLLSYRTECARINKQ
ncbi:TetR/AcrR family transcriptional regulator [Paenibacillus sp. GbtcB18]|uniref:TetR/AcrR family transcriptional regulator n=1 Tax=Paenibacillus sp. GbtcB18 TaxID=2824763 RepID=UPI001C304313|nr:TetR/AcrR family transcriptional regulator [Paenibacillus sp. GbtcB18]